MTQNGLVPMVETVGAIANRFTAEQIDLIKRTIVHGKIASTTKLEMLTDGIWIRWWEEQVCYARCERRGSVPYVPRGETKPEGYCEATRSNSGSRVLLDEAARSLFAGYDRGKACGLGCRAQLWKSQWEVGWGPPYSQWLLARSFAFPPESGSPRICQGTRPDMGGVQWRVSSTRLACAPQEWRQDRQPTREPRSHVPSETPRSDSKPAEAHWGVGERSTEAQR